MICKRHAVDDRNDEPETCRDSHVAVGAREKLPSAVTGVRKRSPTEVRLRRVLCVHSRDSLPRFDLGAASPPGAVSQSCGPASGSCLPGPTTGPAGQHE
jgi:hypothetical protein